MSDTHNTNCAIDYGHPCDCGFFDPKPRQPTEADTLRARIRDLESRNADLTREITVAEEHYAKAMDRAEAAEARCAELEKQLSSCLLLVTEEQKLEKASESRAKVLEEALREIEDYKSARWEDYHAIARQALQAVAREEGDKA